MVEIAISAARSQLGDLSAAPPTARRPSPSPTMATWLPFSYHRK
ncbi:hypothetical protein QQY66_30825 [Streptomyces sp. DG2A-72]|nr:hypothetical protein [Streptomyces sp. DG2A-72]MDO0935867.1 hypothetical protein [Streptomyces sp. DG2A-72]